VLVLPSFREFGCASLLVNPDVFAGVLTDLEILFRCPSFSLIDCVFSRAGISVIFGLKSSTDGEGLCFVGRKGVNVLVLTCFRELCSSSLLIDPDVLAGVLADLEILFSGHCNGLIFRVLTRTRVFVILGLESTSDSKRVALVGGKSVSMFILAYFRELGGSSLLIDPDVFADVLADLKVLFCRPGFCLVDSVFSRARISVVFGLESSTDGEGLGLVGSKGVDVIVLACFWELCSSSLLINPDVFAGVLADFEILLCRSSLSLVACVLTGARILIILSFKRTSDGKSLGLVSLKSVLVGVLGSLGVLSGDLQLILPDVLASVLADLEILFGSPGLGLVNRVLSRTGVRVVFGLERCTDGEGLGLVGSKGVFVLVLAYFRELCGSFLLIDPNVFAGVLTDLEILFGSPGLGLVNRVLSRTGV